VNFFTNTTVEEGFMFNTPKTPVVKLGGFCRARGPHGPDLRGVFLPL
jgi:hypothetical protein